MSKERTQTRVLIPIAAIIAVCAIVGAGVFSVLWFDISSNIWARRVLFGVLCLSFPFGLCCGLYMGHQILAILRNPIVIPAAAKKTTINTPAIGHASLPIMNRITVAMIEARNNMPNTPATRFRTFLADFCEGPLFITLLLLWEPYHLLRRVSTKNERHLLVQHVLDRRGQALGLTAGRPLHWLAELRQHLTREGSSQSRIGASGFTVVLQLQASRSSAFRPCLRAPLPVSRRCRRSSPS